MSWIDQRPDDAMNGAFDVVAPTPVSCVDQSLFREAMSRLGAAVHVITTDGAAGRSGFTASAVCSVSDSPPMLLVCVNRRSQSAPLLRENGIVCVNTLSAGEANVADVFAGRTREPMAQRFAVGEWMTLATGAPVLMSAVVAFDCRIVEIRPVASHNVIFAAVEGVRLGPTGPALVYHERAYKAV